MKIQLDYKKLLGYRIASNNTSKLGAKAGTKIGAKAGVKTGPVTK